MQRSAAGRTPNRDDARGGQNQKAIRTVEIELEGDSSPPALQPEPNGEHAPNGSTQAASKGQQCSSEVEPKGTISTASEMLENFRKMRRLLREEGPQGAAIEQVVTGTAPGSLQSDLKKSD